MSTICYSAALNRSGTPEKSILIFTVILPDDSPPQSAGVVVILSMVICAPTGSIDKMRTRKGNNDFQNLFIETFLVKK